MFPEGTRKSKGIVKKFEHRPRTGAARIALTAGVPLVPAAIKGTDRLSRLPKLEVAYGPPVPVDDLAGLTAREASRAATERLMESIYDLYHGL
jgi:1-acyl-sn-glycerol-3-phosphate acyltransferase